MDLVSGDNLSYGRLNKFSSSGILVGSWGKVEASAVEVDGVDEVL